MTIAKREGGKRSLIAMAAYRSGEKLYSELYQKYNYYQHRDVQPETFILKPNYVPDEFLDRQNLWNKMELAEKQVNSQLCREINVALPLELNKKDQRKLLEEFVKDNFVAQGMIADITIHREHKNNPHAHIMLAMREVDSKGNILNKRKRIPKLDKEGKPILDSKGKPEKISVKTNNWDRRTFVSEIRSDWAKKVNRYFRERGIDQQITEKSFVKLGKKELPSIHEGVYSKKLEEKGIISDLRKKNLAIQDYNDVLNELNKLEDRKKVLEKDPNFTLKFEKNFSPMEKKELKELARGLKIFINDRNIDKRLNELKRWENSLLFNNKVELQEQRLLLGKISDEREMLKQADTILNQQAKRFFKRAYPVLNIDKFSKQEVRAMVNETLFRKKLLNKEQLAQVIYDYRTVKLEKDKKLFTEKPFQTDRYLEMKIKQLDKEIQAETGSKSRVVLELKQQKLVNLKEGLKEYIQIEVTQRFGQDIKIKNVIEGEMLLAKAEYYHTTDFSQLPDKPIFTSEQINNMLEQSKGYLANINEISNDCQGVFFIKDSMDHGNKLTPLARYNLGKIISKNMYIPEEDKQLLNRSLEEIDRGSFEKRETEIKVFRLTKLIDRLLGGKTQQKERNLEKLIKQTQASKNKKFNRNIPLR